MKSIIAPGNGWTTKGCEVRSLLATKLSYKTYLAYEHTTLGKGDRDGWEVTGIIAKGTMIFPYAKKTFREPNLLLGSILVDKAVFHKVDSHKLLMVD